MSTQIDHERSIYPLTRTMNSSDNDKPAQSKKWLPMLSIACIAIAAGVFAGTRHSEKSSPAANEQQSAQTLETALQSATLFPDDFKQLPEFSLPYGDNQTLSEWRRGQACNR